MKTIFFGSGSFAVKILQGILKMPFLEVAAVVTQPDKPAGRDKKLTPCPVKTELNTTNYQGKIYAPIKLREEFAPMLEEIQPDFILVADYGQIIPTEIIDYPKFKCLNVHGSLLPDLRGAVPAAIALLKGYKTTGVSIPVMTPRLDDGAVVASSEIEILPDDTTHSLRMRLADCGVELLERTLPDWFAGKIIPVVQDEAKATITRQSDIAKEQAQITHETSVVTAERMVRAYIPWPQAWCTVDIGGKIKRLKILKAKLTTMPGFEFEKFKITKISKRLFIEFKDGLLELESLQLEGKNIGDSGSNLFLAGVKLT
jgi:methionyl-tRNA formyltransferase